MSEEAKWYVVHTYSGYEKRVKANIEKTVEKQDIGHLIKEIRIPMQEVVEVKKGKRTKKEKKIYPSYIIINMVMNNETWYVVRNTRGVTSFVGPGSKPVPLSDREMRSMGISAPVPEVDFEVGERVKIISGPFKNSKGDIKEIMLHKQNVVVVISAFGRETPVNVDFTQVEKIL